MRQNVIYGIISCVLLFLVCLALYFSLTDKNCNSLSFSLDTTATLIGILVSTVGLFITAYFIILAIDAYSSIQEIKQVKEIAQKDIETIQYRMDEIDNISRNYAQVIYNNLEVQILLIESFKLKDLIDLRNELILYQARLAYTCPLIDKSKRLELILKLGDIGEEIDLHNIVNILYNPNEDSDTKENAKLACEVLKNKIINN